MLIQADNGTWINVPSTELYSIRRSSDKEITIYLTANSLAWKVYQINEPSQLNAEQRTKALDFMIVWLTHAIDIGVAKLPQSAFAEAYRLIESRILNNRPDEHICDQLLTHATFSCQRWIMTSSGPVCLKELPDFIYGDSLGFIKDGRQYRLFACESEDQAKLVFLISRHTRGILGYASMRQGLTKESFSTETTTPTNTRRIVVD